MGQDQIGELPSIKKSLSRRDFLKLSAATFFGAALGSRLNSQPTLFERDTLPQEPPLTSSTEYGFCTHLSVFPKEGDNLTLDFFKKNVDFLAKNNQQWIRFDIRPWEVVSSYDTDFTWNEEGLKRYTEAVEYAHAHGLTIALVAGFPEKIWDKNNPDKAIQTYFQTLSDQFRGKVASWQITNESDVHDFRTYDLIGKLPDWYLKDLSRYVNIAHTSIKGVDPHTKTTVNCAGGWIGRDPREIQSESGKPFFDFFPFIDEMTLDLYPTPDTLLDRKLPNYIHFFEQKYKKPVSVGEIGLFTAKVPIGEYIQANYIPIAVKQLQEGKYRPNKILVYELTDEQRPTVSVPIEHSMGILDETGRPKQSARDVLEVMSASK